MKVDQNVDVNLGSRSEITETGIPCSLKISLKNVVAQSAAESVAFEAIKCPWQDRRSTIIVSAL